MKLRSESSIPSSVRVITSGFGRMALSASCSDCSINLRLVAIVSLKARRCLRELAKGFDVQVFCESMRRDITIILRDIKS